MSTSPPPVACVRKAGAWRRLHSISRHSHLHACGRVAAVILLLSGAAAGAELDQLRARALELVNASRAANDLPTLRAAEAPSKAAMAHAEDMLQRNYYAHTSPDGGTVADRYRAAGGAAWRLTAENIARCAECNPPATIDSVERLHEGWMNSPEHRANILRRGLETFGFGIAVSQNRGLYAVQTFAGPGVPRGVAEGQDWNPLPAHEQDDYAAAQINDARRKAGIASLKSSTLLSETARFVLADERISVENGLRVDNIFDRLPPSERQNWRSLTVLSASCGGCGTQPSDADVDAFVEQWLKQPDYRRILLDRQWTSLGFAMRANGEGEKVVLAILGQPR